MISSLASLHKETRFFRKFLQRNLSSSHFQLRFFSSAPLKESYENILVSQHDPSEPTKEGHLSVGLITLNRPKALNALNDALFADLLHATNALNANDRIGSIVITGKGKAFAAGADIEEMSKKEFTDVYKSNMFAAWTDLNKCPKPIIAAVNGFCLGGGCELAMMCDIILASTNAKFGQPEINLGIIPGMGGTQRLIRSVGKSKAMRMILTGNMIDAEQAEKDGLVAQVYEREALVDEAVAMGLEIGKKSQMSVRMAKEAVDVANEISLEEGLNYERRLFHSLFATNDQKEGMSAFLNKIEPDFKHS